LNASRKSRSKIITECGSAFCFARCSDFVVPSATVHSRRNGIRGKCAGRKPSEKLPGKNSVSIQHSSLRSGATYLLSTAANCGNKLVSWCRNVKRYDGLFSRVEINRRLLCSMQFGSEYQLKNGIPTPALNSSLAMNFKHTPKSL